MGEERIAELGELIAQGRERVLTVAAVQRFLGRSKRAFYQLRRDAEEAFPPPFRIQSRDHWLSSDLARWVESKRRRDAVPGRSAIVKEEET